MIFRCNLLDSFKLLEDVNCVGISYRVYFLIHFKNFINHMNFKAPSLNS